MSLGWPSSIVIRNQCPSDWQVSGVTTVRIYFCQVSTKHSALLISLSFAPPSLFSGLTPEHMQPLRWRMPIDTCPGIMIPFFFRFLCSCGVPQDPIVFTMGGRSARIHPVDYVIFGAMILVSVGIGKGSINPFWVNLSKNVIAVKKNPEPVSTGRSTGWRPPDLYQIYLLNCFNATHMLHNIIKVSSLSTQ